MIKLAATSKIILPTAVPKFPQRRSLFSPLSDHSVQLIQTFVSQLSITYHFLFIKLDKFASLGVGFIPDFVSFLVRHKGQLRKGSNQFSQFGPDPIKSKISFLCEVFADLCPHPNYNSRCKVGLLLHLGPPLTVCTHTWGRGQLGAQAPQYGGCQEEAYNQMPTRRRTQAFWTGTSFLFQFQGNIGTQIMINATHSHLTITVQLLHYGRYVDYDIFENIDVK